MSSLFKNRKKVIISLFTLITLIFSIIGIIILTNGNNKTKDPKFIYNSGHYITDQEAIGTSSLTSNYTKMSSLYTSDGATITRTAISVDANKKIAIESALDFYAFTKLANSVDAFLGYDYELLTNIDLANIDMEGYDLYPIGYNNKMFSGIFNGNGHIIKNLKLVTVSTTTQGNFTSTHYFALFCQTSTNAYVGNFGLVNPKISINMTAASTEDTSGIYYVSNVVGKNNGTVEYVFVRDNLTDDEEKTTPGIDLLSQGFHVSGLVAVNTGTFANSYYASSTVISSSNTKPAELQEVLLKNSDTDTTGTITTGTINNLFFYNSLIESVAKTEDDKIRSVTYGGFIDKTINYTTHFGEYEESVDDLNTAVLGTNGPDQINTWYMGSSYEGIGELSTYFDSVITPVTRGFAESQVTYADNKYHVTIENAGDFSYIYELMDSNSKFASNEFIYEIDPKNDDGTSSTGINLDNVISPKYSNGIASTFITKGATANSSYATLYLNSFSYKVTTLGIDAYGVFPYLTGTVKYLNFVVGGSSQLEFDKVSENISSYGAIAGYAEGATIDYCNVYNNFKITNKVGKYFVGGAVGILAGEGKVSNTTSAGKIVSDCSNTSSPNNFDDPIDYPAGSIVAGVIGYVDSSFGSVDTLYNETLINAEGYRGVASTVTNQEFICGGIIGAGYLLSAENLQNNGAITISNSKYSKLYVSGVIARLLGVGSQIKLFTNNGDITVTQIDAPTYVSGVLNADIQTTTTIGQSLFKEKSKFYFYASALTNGANVKVTGTAASTYMYTNVVNVFNDNGFISKLSGLYNLDYKFNAPSTSLGEQSISVDLFNNFAPVFISNSIDTNDTVELITIYNLRNMKFTQTSDITSNLLYTGCVLGKNINYTDVRNEGNISFTVEHNIKGNVKVFGVFEEVSVNQTAKSIYNGGNIDFKIKSNITGNIFISGICYSNVNHTKSSFYENANPLDKTFNKKYCGTLDNVINSGDITFGLNDILTSTTKGISDTPSSYTIAGDVLISGITIMNQSTITNTFNLGDILAASGFTSDRVSICAGISSIQSGSNASIINSANNGDIKNINMSKKAYIYAGGVVGRNDKTINVSDNLADISSTANTHLQNIAFSINYGLVLAFNGLDNPEMSPTNLAAQTSISGGIIAAGLCNIVNVVNYGKVYGSQLSAGIIAICNFNKFKEEVTDTSHVTIANCLTYPAAYAITHTISETGTAKGIYYSEVRELYSSRADQPIYMETPSATDNTYNGTVIAVINFDNSENAQYIDIRYLVSFSTVVQAFRLQINIPDSVTGNTQTMYSANTNQMYLGGALVYSPLSTMDDELGNIGIFSENFRFRKAISGQLGDGTTYYNTNLYTTDLYLTDFFEFVGFTKVNPYILNKIGWDTISYAAAATDFVKNLDELEIVIKSYKQQTSSGFNDLITKAFNTSTWIQYCDQTVLASLLEDLLNAQDLSSLKAITNYLFFTSSNKSSITVSMREAFATTLINEFNESNIDLREFLDTIITSQIIAEVIAGNDYNNEIVKNKIEEYIGTLSNNNLVELTYKYLDYLKNGSYVELFSNQYKDYYSAEKIELLTALLENLDSDIIVDLTSELTLSGTESTSYKLKLALDSLTNFQKSTLYQQFINDLSNGSQSVLSTVEAAISKLLSTYDIASYTKETDTTEIDAFSNSVTSDTNKVDLWNIIKNDQTVLDYLDEYYQSQDMYVYDANTGVKHTGFLAKATEYRNTYQTNDTPSKYEWTYNNNTGLSTLNTTLTPRDSNTTNYTGDNKYGKYRVSTDDKNMVTRYIYTPDDLVTDGTISYEYTYENYSKTVTPKTYYYGPYLSDTVLSDKHGQLWSNTSTTGANGIGRNLKLNTNTGGTAVQGYIPFFSSLDQEFVNNIILNTQYGSANIEGVSSSTEYIWNNNSYGHQDGDSGNSQTQWVCIDILSKKPNNNQFILKLDHTSQSKLNPYTSTSVNPIVNGFNYDLAGLTTTTELKNYKLSYNQVKAGSSSFNRNDIIRSYVTATYITGIYYSLSQWGQNGLFITAKNNEGYGVITTSYIDYTIDDLVNLNGILTKGRSQHGAADDEIEIINKVIGHLFDTAKGKSVVMTALGKHFASSVDNASLAQKYLNAFANNQTWKNAFLSKIPFTTETYGVSTYINYNNSTVQGYLEGIYNTLSHSSYQNIILYSLDNKSNFTKVLEYLLDKKYGYYSYIQSLDNSLDNSSYYDWFDDVGIYSSDDYTSSELNYLIEYIIANSSNAQLDTIISGVDDTTINTILQATLTNTYDVSGQTISGYTFGNNALAVLDYNLYSGTNYYSSIKFNDSSTVTFTTASYSGVKEKVVAYGTGTISIGNVSYNLTNTPTEYTFELDGNTEYSMAVSNNVSIIKLEESYGSSTDVEMTNTRATATFSGTLTPYNTTYSLNGLDVTGIQLNSGDSITVKLPSAISGNKIYVACLRATNRNSSISIASNSTTRTVTATNTAESVQSSGNVSGDTLTFTTNRNVYIYGFTTANGATESYYYFQDMLYIDGEYYLPSRTTTQTSTASVIYSGTNIVLTYKRNGSTNSTVSFASNNVTATTTTQTYTATSSVLVEAISGTTNIELVGNTTAKSLNGNTLYDNVINNIKTSGTANNYFAYTSNDLSNLIIKKRLAEASCKYNLDVSNLSTTGILSYTDDYNFFSITGTNAYSARKVSDTSTTVLGKTYTYSLQMPNSNSAYVSFAAAANSYLYIMVKTSVSARLNITNGTDTYVVELNRADSVYAINIKNAGTYRIYSSGATSYIYDIYYATGATTTIGSVYNATAAKGTYIKSIFTNYSNFVKYYNRNSLFESSTNISANDRKFNEVVDLLYGVVGTTNANSDLDLYNKLTDEQIIDIIKHLFKYQDNFLRSAITDSTGNYITREELINEISVICKADSKFIIDVFNQANISSSNITETSTGDYYSWVYRLIAAYVSTDYLMNYDERKMDQSTLTESDLYDIIAAINGHSYIIGGHTYSFTPDCQFISSDTTIAGTNFQNLMTALGNNLSSSGYGIYALSSSRGKLNGEFIPDNLSLDTMDPGYTTDNNRYYLIDNNEGSEDASLTDAKWRGGNGTTEGEDNTSDYTGDNVTVNQAFYIEMKQLIKSISTTVFELTLENGGNEYYGDIDLDNATITYYVPSLTTGDYTVSTIDLAYEAKAYVGAITSPSGTRFKDGSTITVNSVGEVGQFTVFAEDTKVYKTYKVIFKLLTTHLTMVYDTDKTEGASTNSLTVTTSTQDKEVVLNITSNNEKLPKGFDLKPYLSLTDGTNTYSMNSEYVKISTISTDHKVKDDGTAVATLMISYKLPAGTYYISLSVCGCTPAQVTYIKSASGENKIISMSFDGKAVGFADNKKNVTSDIKFGRAYNNIELTDIDGIYSKYYDFYLDSYEISPNATISASVSKSQATKTYYFDEITSTSYKITSYVITYTVTAENGDTNVYKHTLKELDPYVTTDEYASVYKDGNLFSSNVNTHFDSTTENNHNNQTIVTFERGSEAYYRLKYDFTNIYTLSNNITYSKEDTTVGQYNGIATLNLEYRGISVDVNESCDAGTYSFLYKYSNKQEWNITATKTGEGTYSFTVGTTSYIEYTFPRLVVNKTYSTDATLHSILLMDAYKEQSKASTVMDVDVLRPIENPGNDEIYYQNLFLYDNLVNIKVGDTINYKYKSESDDYTASNFTDYYTVGMVSNALLNNYAPTFSIEKHGMIFQSTTLAKIKNYGDKKQGTATDASILGDHLSEDGSILFIYVPFTYTSNGETKNRNFLIKMDGKNLTDVYIDKYTGVETKITTLSGITLNSIRNMKLDSNITKPSFTYGGVVYTLSDDVGNATNNPGLNMDYIGSPLNDHFWYVSYVVFSEDYIRSDAYTHLKFYHIALIDISNNVYFTIKVVTPNDATFTSINNIYVTVLGHTPKDKNNEEFKEIVVGTYVGKKVVDTTANTITYELIYSIQILPSSYYFFYIDLPGGYVATSTISDSSKVFVKGISSDYLNHISDYSGAYLPPSSIVVQRVPVTITVTTGSVSSSSWAIATSDIYTRDATYVEAYTKVAIDGTLDISSTIPFDTSGAVTWESSNEDILTVSSSGVLTGKAAGIAIVTFTKGNNTFKTLVYVEETN